MPGDRAMLLRQRRDRGLVASGWFTTQIYEDLHWDGTDRVTQFADIDFDCLLTVDERLPTEVLVEQVAAVPWNRLQGSGVRVPDDAAVTLDELWHHHLGEDPRRTPTSRPVYRGRCPEMGGSTDPIRAQSLGPGGVPSSAP